jgi:hypothetical protein
MFCDVEVKKLEEILVCFENQSLSVFFDNFKISYLICIDGKYRVKEELETVYRLKNGIPLTTNYAERIIIV